MRDGLSSPFYVDSPSGLAITLTTTTSLVSFIIGLNTGYLSIKNFCWFCGSGTYFLKLPVLTLGSHHFSGMFFGYIFVLTFFFAIHCLDAKREEENMVCLFCVPNNERVGFRIVLKIFTCFAEGVTPGTAPKRGCTVQ